MNFLAQHAGRVISDPQVAIVELVANAWDAGADRVAITWPSEPMQILAVEDNGTGMSRKEFAFRWNMLSYSRVQFQGSEVQFLKGVRHRTRSAFGRNGEHGRVVDMVPNADLAASMDRLRMYLRV